MKKHLKILPVCLLFVIGDAEPVQSQHAYHLDSNYVLFEIYQQHLSDSITHQLAVGFTIGVPLRGTGLVFEWQRPLISGVKFHNRADKDRLASTALVMGVIAGGTAVIMSAFGKDAKSIDKAAIYAMLPFGPHLGWRANSFITFYAGAIPDVMLFSEDDGILAQGRVGLRIDSKEGLVFNMGYAKTRFWGFESPGRVFPRGIFLGLSYASPIGSGLFG